MKSVQNQKLSLKQKPPPKPVGDQLCHYVHPEGHEKAGQRCQVAHMKDSKVCYPHAMEGTLTPKQESLRKLKELQADLQTGYHSLRTRLDVQQLNEKIVNGILTGIVRRDQATMLGVFIPLAWKISKELEGTIAAPTIKITNVNHTEQIVLSMDPETLDRYLGTKSGAERAVILEDFQKQNNIRLVKKDTVIDAEVKEVEPSKVRIPAGELAEISKGTDLPLTVRQAGKLFGKNLGDVNVEQEANRVDQVGYGHLFERKRDVLPEEQAAKFKHKQKLKFVDGKMQGTKVSRYTCEWCGYVSGSLSKEICPNSWKGLQGNETNNQHDANQRIPDQVLRPVSSELPLGGAEEAVSGVG